MHKALKQTWPLPKPQEILLGRYFRRMFNCDNARLISPLKDKIFLIIGFKQNTQGDQWVWKDQNGNVLNWDYLLETTIANGNNIDELISNAKRYKSLKGKTALDLITEEIKTQ
jgi:hypothetical protein